MNNDVQIDSQTIEITKDLLEALIAAEFSETNEGRPCISIQLPKLAPEDNNALNNAEQLLGRLLRNLKSGIQVSTITDPDGTSKFQAVTNSESETVELKSLILSELIPNLEAKASKAQENTTSSNASPATQKPLDREAIRYIEATQQLTAHYIAEDAADTFSKIKPKIVMDDRMGKETTNLVYNPGDIGPPDIGQRAVKILRETLLSIDPFLTTTFTTDNNQIIASMSQGEYETFKGHLGEIVRQLEATRPAEPSEPIRAKWTPEEALKALVANAHDATSSFVKIDEEEGSMTVSSDPNDQAICVISLPTHVEHPSMYKASHAFADALNEVLPNAVRTKVDPEDSQPKAEIIFTHEVPQMVFWLDTDPKQSVQDILSNLEPIQANAIERIRQGKFPSRRPDSKISCTSYMQSIRPGKAMEMHDYILSFISILTNVGRDPKILAELEATDSSFIFLSPMDYPQSFSLKELEDQLNSLFEGSSAGISFEVRPTDANVHTHTHAKDPKISVSALFNNGLPTGHDIVTACHAARHQVSQTPDPGVVRVH